MKFSEFQSLVNENPKNVTPILSDSGIANRICYVTEKVHGANFGIWWNGQSGEIRFSKRTSFIGEEDNFFQWRRYFTDEKINHLTKTFKDIFKNCNIVIFGELFGGGTDFGVKPVQREINYGCDISFLAFQMKVLDFDGNVIVTLNYPIMATLLESFEIEPVPLIDSGVLKDMYANLDPCNIRSKVSSVDAPIEGLVFTVYNVDSSPIILKKRSKEFLETKHTGVANIAYNAELCGKMLQIATEVESMCTEQRVSNVNSHFGFTELSNFGDLMSAVVKDILKDLGTVEKEVEKFVKKQACRHLIPLVRAELSK